MLKMRNPVGRHLQQLQTTEHNAFALPLLDRAGPLYCEQALRLIPNVRASFRGRFGNRDCMVKVFFSPRRHKLDCTTELNGLAHLASAGCRIPEIIYVGPSSDQAASVLVMEWQGEASNIAALFEQSNDAQKQTLLTQLTTTLARLHTAGCQQHDIQYSNFLSLNDEIICLDGEQVQHHNRAIASDLGNDNLARFCAQWPPRYDAMLKQAIAAYALTRFGDSNRLSNLFSLINRYRQQRLRQIFELNSEHSTALSHDHSTQCSGVILTAWKNPQWSEVLSTPDRFTQLNWSSTAFTVQGWPTPSWWSRMRQKNSAQRQFRFAQVLDAFAIKHTPTIAWIDSWQQQTPRSFALIEEHASTPWQSWLAAHGDHGVAQVISLLQQWQALFLFAREGEFNVQADNDVLSLHHLDTLAHCSSGWRYRRRFRQMLINMIDKLAAQPALQTQFLARVVELSWLSDSDIKRLGLS